MFAVAECDSVTFSSSVNTSRYGPYPVILWNGNAPVGFAQSRCEVLSQIVTVTLLKLLVFFVRGLTPLA